MDPHRNEAKATKLAKALAMKYLVELDPRKPHKYNVYALLGDELYALTRQVMRLAPTRVHFLCPLRRAPSPLLPPLGACHSKIPAVQTNGLTDLQITMHA